MDLYVHQQCKALGIAILIWGTAALALFAVRSARTAVRALMIVAAARRCGGRWAGLCVRHFGFCCVLHRYVRVAEEVHCTHSTIKLLLVSWLVLACLNDLRVIVLAKPSWALAKRCNVAAP